MCGKDLTLRVRLECCECSDCEVCLQCMSKGEETSEHLRRHNYKVVDKNHFKLLGISTVLTNILYLPNLIYRLYSIILIIR